MPGGGDWRRQSQTLLGDTQWKNKLKCRKFPLNIILLFVYLTYSNPSWTQPWTTSCSWSHLRRGWNTWSSGVLFLPHWFFANEKTSNQQFLRITRVPTLKENRTKTNNQKKHHKKVTKQNAILSSEVKFTWSPVYFLKPSIIVQTIIQHYDKWEENKFPYLKTTLPAF